MRDVARGKSQTLARARRLGYESYSGWAASRPTAALIAAGVSLFYLARLMGSSVEQIDRTYGHMLPESEDYLRGLLDNYDVNSAAEVAVEGGSG